MERWWPYQGEHACGCDVWVSGFIIGNSSNRAANAIIESQARKEVGAVIDGFWSSVLAALTTQLSNEKPSLKAYCIAFFGGAIAVLLLMIFWFCDGTGLIKGIDLFCEALFTPLVPLAMIGGGLFSMAILWIRVEH